MDVVSAYDRIPRFPSPDIGARLRDCQQQPVYRLRVRLAELSSQREMLFVSFARHAEKNCRILKSSL